MAWTLRAMGMPTEGDTRKWRGSLSSSLLPNGILACRAAVLNLLADGVDAGVRSWSAVGAITYSSATAQPITVAYADVEVPAISVPITDDSVSKRTVFDVLVKMSDPGRTIAELEALAAQNLGRGTITRLLDLSRGRTTPSIEQLFARIHTHRII